MYETFEHTADVGLRIEADSRDELFAEAARGFFSLFVDDPASVEPRQEVTIEVPGEELEYLLFDWLNELLYGFESKRMLLAEFDVAVSDTGLKATARGEPFDESRHRLGFEVKAVTYHGLKVEEVDGRWRAEVILDI